MAEDLKSLITPDLLDFLVNARVPFPKTGPINFDDVWRQFFDDSFGSAIKERVWPVLVALSKLGLDNIPDLWSFLPPKESVDFPRQVLGMQILLDQSPRTLCSGIDSRWVNGYFDPISIKFAESWFRLPNEQTPNGWPRWQNDERVSLEYWALAHLWFCAPFVHNEAHQNQEIALGLTEGARQIVEGATGKTDPWRAKRDEVLTDLYGFPRAIRAGTPGGKQDFASWFFHMGMILDIHKPIIDKFERYPYQNAVRGRESTAEELEWIEKTDHFGNAPPDVANVIKQDVKAGRWQPLGSGHSTWRSWIDDRKKADLES